MSMQFYTAYFFIFSPYLGIFGSSTDVANYVRSDGDVGSGWDVGESYGRSSPGLDNFDNIYAHNVDSYGDISNYAKPNNTVTDSCGVK